MKQKQDATETASDEISAVRGKPKSGRVWKDENRKFSNLLIQKSNRTSWDKKVQIKNEKKLVKQREEDMKKERKQKIIELHERQKLNEQRRIENERKAEIVQIVKDPRKIAKLRKKQMRQYEKRDLSKIKAI